MDTVKQTGVCAVGRVIVFDAMASASSVVKKRSPTWRHLWCWMTPGRAVEGVAGAGFASCTLLSNQVSQYSYGAS